MIFIKQQKLKGGVTGYCNHSFEFISNAFGVGALNSPWEIPKHKHQIPSKHQKPKFQYLNASTNFIEIGPLDFCPEFLVEYSVFIKSTRSRPKGSHRVFNALGVYRCSCEPILKAAKMWNPICLWLVCLLPCTRLTKYWKLENLEIAAI